MTYIFVHIKRPRVLRQVGYDEIARETNGQTDQPVHDLNYLVSSLGFPERHRGNVTHKQPLPPGQPADAVQTRVDAGLEISAEHAGGGRRRVEDAGPLAQLARLVPAAQDGVRGRVEAGLGEADEEANRHHVLGAGGQGEAEGQQRPDELAARDPDRGPDPPGQHHLRRDLPRHVARRPRRVHEVDLVPRHAQVLLHAAHERVGHVALVQVLDEVSQRQHGDEVDVELPEEGPLLGRPVRVAVPEVGRPRCWCFCRRRSVGTSMTS